MVAFIQFSSAIHAELLALLCTPRYSHNLKYSKTLHLSSHYTLLKFFLFNVLLLCIQTGSICPTPCYSSIEKVTKLSVCTHKNSEPALTSAHSDQAGYYYTRTHRNKFKNQVFVGCAIINTGTVLLLTTLCIGLSNTSLEQALSLPEFNHLTKL